MADKKYKDSVGQGISPFTPLATLPGHIPQFGQTLAAEGTGTVLSLNRVAGTNYNYATPSAATTYTTVTPIINGYASCKINAPTEPTVTGATKISGATFAANADMEMIVESKDGVNARYFFLEL